MGAKEFRKRIEILRERLRQNCLDADLRLHRLPRTVERPKRRGRRRNLPNETLDRHLRHPAGFRMTVAKGAPRDPDAVKGIAAGGKTPGLYKGVDAPPHSVPGT